MNCRGDPIHIQSTISPLIPSNQPNILKYRITNNHPSLENMFIPVLPQFTNYSNPNTIPNNINLDII